MAVSSHLRGAEGVMVNVIEAVGAVMGKLVSVRHWDDASFINLPLIYPGGGAVTVKVDRVSGGYRVSDNGFAYREAECIGAQRSFGKTVSQIAEAESLQRNTRALFIDVPPEQLFRAICDVGAASWRVADAVFSRAAEQEEIEIEERDYNLLYKRFAKLTVEHAEMAALLREMLEGRPTQEPPEHNGPAHHNWRQWQKARALLARIEGGSK